MATISRLFKSLRNSHESEYYTFINVVNVDRKTTLAAFSNKHYFMNQKSPRSEELAQSDYVSSLFAKLTKECHHHGHHDHDGNHDDGAFTVRF